MPLLAGESLETKLQRDVRLSVAEAVAMGRQVAEGLRVAHDAGLIHRDIKPGNLWLEPATDAAPFRVKILDFGLVRNLAQQTEFIVPGSLLGTPAYLAPEQAENREIDGRADLFSFGCVLYQALTGHRPFAGQELFALLRAIGADTPAAPHVVRPDTPRWLSDLVMRLLAKNSDQWVPSARALTEWLNRPPKRSRWRWYAVAAATGLAACAALVAAVLILHNRDGSVTKLEVPR